MKKFNRSILSPPFIKHCVKSHLTLPIKFTLIYFIAGILAISSALAMANTPEKRPITAWPIIYDRVENGRQIKDIMWPFYHYEAFDKTEIIKLRPLFYSSETDSATQTSDIDVLWPFSSFENSPTKRNNYVFPFYWEKHEGDQGYFHIWPLFGKNYDSDYIEYSTLYPFFTRGSSADGSIAKANFPWPIWGYERTPNFGKSYLFPFWYQKESAMSQDTLLFPLFYKHSSEQDKIRFITPFFAQGKLDKNEFSTLFPLYGLRKGPNIHEGYVLPYYWSSNEHRKIKGIIPLWHINQHKDSSISWVLPVYFKKTERHSSKGMFAPYFWNYDLEQKSKGIFPLWYSSDSYEADKPGSIQSSLDLLFPIYFNKTDKDGYLKFITPLYHSLKDDKRSYRAFYPFYYDYQKPDFTFRSLIPFYYQLNTEYEKYLSFFPFYYSYSNEEELRKFDYYFPFYGRSKIGDTVTSRYLLFPLYAHSYFPEDNFHSWDVLWPLIHHEYDEDHLSTRVLPFYWRNKSETSDFTAGFPFYWHYRNQDITLNMVLPFYASYSRDDTYKRQFILGPVYISTIDSDRDLQRRDFLFPLYSKQTQGESTKQWLFPFYYHNKNLQSELSFASLIGLPPYYYHEKTDDYFSFHLWPFYGHSLNTGYEEHSVAWPLYVSKTSAKENKRWLFPIFYHKKNPQVEVNIASLFGLPPYYYHEKTSNDFSFHLWPFYGHSQKGSIQSRSFLWPLTKFETDAENNSSMNYVLPFWYSEDNTKEKTTTSMILYWSNTDKQTLINEKSFFWLVPNTIHLARSNSGPDSSGHSVFPFYTFQKTADSLEWYFPWLLFQHEEKGSFAENLSFLWKLVGYQRQEDNSDFRFLWRFIHIAKSPEKSVLEINPFYYKESKADGSGYTNILGGIISFEH